MILAVASSFLGLDIGNIGSDMTSFTIIWEQQNEGYTGRCMEIPGVKGKGEAITSTLRSLHTTASSHKMKSRINNAKNTLIIINFNLMVILMHV